MKISLFFFTVLFAISMLGQDYLTVAGSNPSLFRYGENNDDKAKVDGEFIYLNRTLSLPFKDDFTRNHLRALNAKITDPGVKDTTFYYLYIGGNIADTSLRFTENVTKIYRFNPDSTPIDTQSLPPIQLTINDYSVYPNQTTLRQVYPAYNVYDTLGKTIDTISITFDYKQDSIKRYLVPDDGKSLWQEDEVLINDDYAKNPPSYGVATFDGLNRLGRAYSFAGTAPYGVADHLTSLPIDLSTAIPSDSVYLSFYYQAKGLSRDGPESPDSLILEFYNASSHIWKKVWSTERLQNTNFHLQLLKISNQFYNSDFQFRFKNKANLSGAWDNWNLDYVYLNKGRSINDTVFDDVAIKQTNISMLADYTSVPFWQYKLLTNVFLRDTVSNLFGNNFNNSKTVYFRYFVSKVDGSYYPPFPEPANQATSTILSAYALQRRIYNFAQAPLSFSYPSADMDTAHTFVSTFVSQFSNVGGVDLFPENDTLFFSQRFDHYLAYDNGTAEAGYGVNVTDTTGGKRGVIAEKFTTLLKDTLNAIAIYFLPQGHDREAVKFNLCVWKDLNSSTGLIYKKSMKDQVYYSAKNGYLIYLLDTSLVVEGDFYIGIEQSSFRSLNVGYDFRVNKKDRIYYSIDGTTFSQAGPSIHEGTLMMRPYFRVSNMQVGLEETNNLADWKIKLYPNPTNGALHLDIDSEQQSLIHYQLYNLEGKLMLSGSFYRDKVLDMSKYVNGLYLIRLIDEKGITVTKRIILAQ